MKRSFGYRLSLGLNVVLAAAVIVVAVRFSAPLPVPIVVQAVAPVEPKKAESDTIRAVASAYPGDQAQPEAVDWRNWIDKLRAQGVPEKILSGLVSADFNERWNKHQADLQRQYDNGDLDAATFDQLNDERDQTLAREMRAALGDSAFVAWDRDRALENFAGGKLDLTSSEKDGIYGLQKDLEKQERELRQKRAQGELDDADTGQQEEALQRQFQEKGK